MEIIKATTQLIEITWPHNARMSLATSEIIAKLEFVSSSLAISAEELEFATHISCTSRSLG